ncbi:hypothetical protein DRP07_01835 [Archaeoglobales archaeon]|nr:MAG: hypothetical protein DRP07_01835 [Archaeoglobales archaeon]
MILVLPLIVNAEICKDTTNWWTGYTSYNRVDSGIDFSTSDPAQKNDYLSYMAFKYKGQPIRAIALYSNKIYIFKVAYTGLTLYNFSGTATLKDVNDNILGNASYEVKRNYKLLTDIWKGYVGFTFGILISIGIRSNTIRR